jgi:NTE family protein
VYELVVQTPPPVHGQASLQFGIGFLDDFDGGSSYHLLARHQLLPANRRGGEWETLFQIGTVAGARTSFYQPLDWGMNWFVEPSLQYQRGTQEIWLDGSAVAEYQFRSSDVRIAAGRVLGRWGEIRIAAYTGEDKGSPRIGLPGFPSVSEQRVGGELSFRIDTEDSVIFPTSGSGMDLRYTHSSESLGSDGEFNRVFGSASHAWSFGKNTLVPYLEYGDNLDPAESFFSLFPMGGLFRLSGLGDNELLGGKIVLARILAYRRLFQIELAGMGIRIIAGLSLEAGNAYDSDATVSWGNTIKGGSVFVGGETFIGPVILAYGRTDGNRDRFYFAIGDRF